MALSHGGHLNMATLHTPASWLSRGLVLSYGAACYVVFLGTFVYALGFVGGFGVPRSIDGDSSGPLSTALAVDLGLLGLFAVQHSVMARPAFKRWLTRLVPEPAERSTYVLMSSAALGLLFWQWRPLGGIVWSVEHPVLAALLYGGFAFGWLLVLITTFLINHFDLFGLRQVWCHFRGVPRQPLRFVVPGPYRLVRHPLYLGWLCAFWFTPHMTVAHLVFALATTGYILIAIRLEERDLVTAHGAEYERYRARTPMIVPRVLGLAATETNIIEPREEAG
jgi:protein-S-isoprenylcysteine O-methyltransferase Ste14